MCRVAFVSFMIGCDENDGPVKVTFGDDDPTEVDDTPDDGGDDTLRVNVGETLTSPEFTEQGA